MTLPLILTANTRLARVLRQQYDQQQIASGLTVWTALEILPLSAWLERCWHSWLYATKASKPAQLLSPTHERTIWETIVARSDAANELLQVAATAATAWNAWNLLHAWQLPLHLGDWEHSRDTEAFRGWADDFRQLCDKRNWLSSARLPRFIAEGITSGDIPPPPHIQLAGFAEFTPTQQQLIDALRRRNSKVDIVSAPTRNAEGSAVRVGFLDTRQEIRAAACWSRKLLDSATETGAPEPAIGIVAPELSAYRSTIERLFAEELHPAGRLNPDQDGQRAFNISLGPAFAEYPLVQIALRILRLNPAAAIPFEDISAILRSPFVAKASAEITAQALLEVRLRRLNEPEVPLSDVLRDAPEGLRSTLEKWKREQETQPSRQMPSDWAAAFANALKSIGWPGDRPLSSAEYQTTAAWNEMLSELAGLDSATGPLNCGAAFSMLQRLAADRQFQPESEPAPIQILGVFEASGMTFDHLWIIGMHDGVWPRSVSANPFLPIRLQRAGNLPQSSPQRELEFTRLLSEQLMASSPDVVVSYPKKDGDADLRHSPMFSSLPAVLPEALELPESPDHAKLLYLSRSEEKISDNTAPAWTGARLRGGTSIFTQQAACPFQAFATIRLGAEPLATAEPGLSAAERGVLVHDVFRRIWDEFGSHETLIETRQPTLDAVVRDEVRLSIAALAVKKSALRQPRFAAIEQERLERLAHEWLDLEKQRAPFIVLPSEQSQLVNVGGIDLTIRADRIDKLTDGSHVIVDYKTSAHRPSEWDGPHPDEPQLPLYAVTAGADLGGVVFGVARLGESRFAGLTAKDGVLPGVKAGSGDDALPNRIPAWRAVLEQLAADFRNGKAIVDPKKPNQTCRYCDLHSLCRISEANLAAGDAQDAEDAEDVDVAVADD